ncbi:MAG: mechanosensitive ion channel family protein [Candidatus Altiarchaeota archaeon]
MLDGFLLNEYYGNTVLSYVKAAVIVLASVIVGKVVYYILNRHIKKLLEKTETKLDDMLVDAAEEPAVVAIFILGLYAASQTLIMPAGLQTYSAEIITAFLILDVVWLVIRLVDIVVNEVVLPVAAKSDTTLDDQLIPILSRGVKVVVIAFGFMIILSNFGFDITALVAGLGIGGLAVALASKDTIENMFGAFAILIDKPFAIRDRVVIDGKVGDVMEVGLRSTRLLTLDHTELYIPNSKVATSYIENISRPTSRLAVTEKLNVTYETSIGKLREGIDIVKGVIAETEGILREYEPTVVFKEFEESSLEVFVKYWVEDYTKSLTVKNSVNQKIKERFEKAGIEFAYPTQKVYIAK